MIWIWGCHLKRDHSWLPTSTCKFNFFNSFICDGRLTYYTPSSLISFERGASTVDLPCSMADVLEDMNSSFHLYTAEYETL